MLMRLTPEGARAEGTLQKEIADVRVALGTMGGSLDAAVITLGPYDAILVGTIGSDEKLAWFASAAASCGLVSYQTLRGFSPEEWEGIQGDTELHTALPFHR
jgi:uncharacterized protein with GYD domain